MAEAGRTNRISPEAPGHTSAEASEARRPSGSPRNAVERVTDSSTILFHRESRDIRVYDEIRQYIAEGGDASYSFLRDTYRSNENGIDMVKLAAGIAKPDCVLKYVSAPEKADPSRDEDEVELEKKRADFRELFQGRLLEAGLVLEVEFDRSAPSECFVKVYAPFSILLIQAETIKLRMRLQNYSVPLCDKPRILRTFFGQSQPRNASALFEVERYDEFTGSDKPPVVEGNEQELTKEETFFSSAHRSLLVHSIISRVILERTWDDQEETPRRGRFKRTLVGDLLEHKVFTKWYFIHDGPVDAGDRNLRSVLRRNWVGSFFSAQPLDAVRDYFGEKRAIYFGWLGYYTYWLGLAAIVGVIVFLYGLLRAGRGLGDFMDNFELVFDNELSAPFALFMSVWATLFLEFWKRQNSRLQVRWSVYDFEQQELDRPGYTATAVRKSPITGEDEHYIPRNQRLIKLVTSTAIVTTSIIMVCLLVGAITVFRPWCKTQFPEDSALPTVFTAVLSLGLIVLASSCYTGLAGWLTDWENHRTETGYEDALILKRYLFEFVNYYSSLFYIAFIKQWVGRNMLGDPRLQDECGFNGSCLSDLMLQLAIIFVGKQLITQVLEVGVPFSKVLIKKRKSDKIAAQRRTSWSRTSISNPGGTVKGVPQYAEDEALGEAGTVFNEYNEMVIQYGFCTLFVAAFPLAPFFAFLNNITEIRTDAYKMITQDQRPPALRAQDIGSWETILILISHLAVPTNAVIIAFSSKTTKRMLGNGYGWRDEENGEPVLGSQLVFILVFEHVVFILKLILAFLVPDVPETCKHMIERDAFLQQHSREKRLERDRTSGAAQAAVRHSQSLEQPKDVVVTDEV